MLMAASGRMPPAAACVVAAPTPTMAGPLSTLGRWFSSGGMDPELRKRVDALNDLFVEAREEIEMAEESKETTYYDEEAQHWRSTGTAARETIRPSSTRSG